MDLSSQKFKGIDSYDINDMMCTLYSYEMESDFIALVNDYLIWGNSKLSKIRTKMEILLYLSTL